MVERNGRKIQEGRNVRKRNGRKGTGGRNGRKGL